MTSAPLRLIAAMTHGLGKGRGVELACGHRWPEFGQDHRREPAPAAGLGHHDLALPPLHRPAAYGGRTVATSGPASSSSSATCLPCSSSRRPPWIVFLDRALPDSLAYYRFLDLPPDPSLLDALTRVEYRKVFLLDLLPLAEDYARTEDAEAQQRIQDLLLEVNEGLNLPLEQVAVLPPGERVELVLARL
jgi:hypothetical protein